MCVSQSFLMEIMIMSLLWRIAYNCIYKIIVFPTVMMIISSRYPKLVTFKSFRSLFILSVTFISIGLVADETIMPRYGNLKSTVQGSIFMSITCWSAQIFSRSMQITWLGAVLIGSILGVLEFPMHRWILQKRKAHTNQ